MEELPMLKLYCPAWVAERRMAGKGKRVEQEGHCYALVTALGWEVMERWPEPISDPPPVTCTAVNTQKLLQASSVLCY